MKAKRIAVFTSTRADYGLLRPLMAEILACPNMLLQTIVTGTHLSRLHDETWREIVTDGFKIDVRIDMQLSDDDSVGVAASSSIVLSETAKALNLLSSDILVLLGDRYELLSAAQAGLLARVPIVHIHGGEATEGAIDESIRHAVSKLAHLHFPVNEVYAKRIIQMGEMRERVHVVGALSMDNISKLETLPLKRLESFIGIELRHPAFLVTYHPVTLSEDGGLGAIKSLLAVLDEFKGSIIITGVNADVGTVAIRECLEKFTRNNTGRVVLVESLGAQRYLSLMKYVDMVIGNSSSGIAEAPAIGTPSVDIGLRQRGRLRAPSVIHCDESVDAIRNAISIGLSHKHCELTQKRETPYGKPGAARRMVNLLQNVEFYNLRKPFVDNP